MRENALIVASLVTWSRDPSLLLRHSSVYSCCLATTRRGDETRSRYGSVRFGSVRHGTEKTPLHLLLRNRGSVFRCYSSCMAYVYSMGGPQMALAPRPSLIYCASCMAYIRHNIFVLLTYLCIHNKVLPHLSYQIFNLQ
jgi:hypothetical protein